MIIRISPFFKDDSKNIEQWTKFAFSANKIKIWGDFFIMFENSDTKYRLGDARLCHNGHVAKIRLSDFHWNELSDEEKKELVVHEVCHIVDKKKNPRKIRKPHGKAWKKYMKNCGYINAKATKKIYSENLRPKTTNLLPVDCGCKEQRFMGPIRFKRLKKGTNVYICSFCKQEAKIPI